MAVVIFPRRRSRKLFDENNEINNTNPPPPPSTPPQELFPFPPFPPLPPVEVNFPAIPPPPDQNSPSSFVALAIAFPVIVAVLVLSCFLRGMELNRRRRRAAAQAAAQPQQPPRASGGGEEVYSGLMVDHPIWYIRTVGLQSHVINAITVCKYKEVEGLVGRRAECAVCLNGFQKDDTLKMLPKCNHAFHVSCIDTWLKSHTNCPVCRAIIELVDVGFPGGGGNRSETRTGTPVDNRRGHRSDINGESERADPTDILNLELRNNNVVKNESEGD